MPLPTLDQVIDLFRERPLPKDEGQGSIEKDVRPCDGDDTLQWKIVRYPDNDDNLLFIEPEQLPASSGFRNMDDSHYRRLMAGTKGLAYKPEGKDGKPSRLKKASLELCRETPASDSASQPVSPGVYALYATDRIVPVLTDLDVLDNDPGVPQLREIPFRFTPEEIVAIVRGVGLNPSRYAVNPYDKSRLLVFPDLSTVERIVEFIGSQKNPSTPEAVRRRASMAAAFRKGMEHEIEQSQAVKGQLDVPPWLLTGLGVLGGTLANIPIMIWMQLRNEKLMRELQQGPKFDVGELYTDATESLRQDGEIKIPQSQRRYVESIRQRFNEGLYPHVVVSGPSGSGKSYTADLVGRLAVNGKLGVESFDGKNVRFVRIDANDIIRSAGAWQNGAQTRFFEVLLHLTQEPGPLIIHLLEADKFAAAGQGPGNQPLNLLKELYTIMEGVSLRYRNVHFILDSTRWQEIQAAAPDMLRRARFLEVAPPLPEDVRTALLSGIENRKLKSKDERIRKRFENVSFAPEALDAVVALGEYRKGAPPSSHLSLIDTLAEEASRRFKDQKVTITRDHVVRLVAREMKTTPEKVEKELFDRLGSKGVAGNAKIQAAIMSGFYAAYAQPMEGKVNPLELAHTIGKEAPSIFEEGGSRTTATLVPPSDPVETTVDFTVDHFYDMIRSRYQSQGRLIDESLARELATDAFSLWEREGKKTTIVDGHVIPLESAVEKTLFKAYQGTSPNNPFQSSFRSAFEADAGRLGEGRTLDSMSESFRKTAKTAFEAAVGK